jgi:hypothetical protein
MKRLFVIVLLAFGAVAGAQTAIGSATTANATRMALVAATGEAFAAGELVAVENTAGVPQAFKADADGVATRKNVIGVALRAALITTNMLVVVSGEVATPDAAWTGGVPAVADVGSKAFLSETAGLWTLTAPVTAGSRVIRVGIVTRGGTGAVKVNVQIGEGTDL